MSVYRTIVISLINSAEYKVIPDAEKAARYNTNSPEYYVLMDSQITPATRAGACG